MNRSKVASAERSETASAGSPGLFRRLAAILYDCFALLAVLYLATALLLPFHHGEGFQAANWAYRLYLIAVCFLYFGWFWTHGGQTVGMRAWKIKVTGKDGSPLGWAAALLRFAAGALSWAVFGLGYLWILFNRNRLAWHDWLSNTHLSKT